MVIMLVSDYDFKSMFFIFKYIVFYELNRRCPVPS